MNVKIAVVAMAGTHRGMMTLQEGAERPAAVDLGGVVELLGQRPS